jgi:hypothetical protein
MPTTTLHTSFVLQSSPPSSTLSSALSTGRAADASGGTENSSEAQTGTRRKRKILTQAAKDPACSPLAEYVHNALPEPEEYVKPKPVDPPKQKLETPAQPVAAEHAPVPEQGTTERRQRRHAATLIPGTKFPVFDPAMAMNKQRETQKDFNFLPSDDMIDPHIFPETEKEITAPSRRVQDGSFDLLFRPHPDVTETVAAENHCSGAAVCVRKSKHCSARCFSIYRRRSCES